MYKNREEYVKHPYFEYYLKILQNAYPKDTHLSTKEVADLTKMEHRTVRRNHSFCSESTISLVELAVDFCIRSDKKKQKLQFKEVNKNYDMGGNFNC